MIASPKPGRYAGRDMALERLVVALLESGGNYFNALGQLDLERLMRDARALQGAIRTKPEGGAQP